MKKIMVSAMVMSLVLIGVAIAAPVPVFKGPVGFNITVTEQGDTFPRKLYNNTTRFNGTITMDPNSGEPDFPIVIIEGTVSDGTNVTISCTADHNHMAGVSALADNSKMPVNDKWTLLAGCSFTANDGSGPLVQGVAFLNLTGTQKRPKGWTNDYPESVKITGAQINGGVTDDPINVFVFKGTFSSTLLPQ
jgi:hypothetical protein